MTEGCCYKVLLLLVLVALVGPTACSDKSNDIENTMSDYIELLMRFGKDLSESSGRDEVLEAVRSYRKGVQNLLPRFRQLDQKYPKLSRALAQDKPARELPPRLRKLKKRLTRVRQEVIDEKVQKKLQKYSNDSQVILELTKIRQSIQRKGSAEEASPEASPKFSGGSSGE